jgi:hypothetical protein
LIMFIGPFFIRFLCFFRLPEGPILAKDLAIEYKYLSNTSEWFFIARKSAESVIQQAGSLRIGKKYNAIQSNRRVHAYKKQD